MELYSIIVVGCHGSTTNVLGFIGIYRCQEDAEAAARTRYHLTYEEQHGEPDHPLRIWTRHVSRAELGEFVQQVFPGSVLKRD